MSQVVTSKRSGLRPGKPAKILAIQEMKTALPWIVAIAALTGAYFFFSAGQKKSSELASLRAVVAEGEQVRDENDGLIKLKVQANEIARLKKENEGAAKLQEEIQQLREDKQGLANQIQAAQESIEAARAKIITANSRPTQPEPAPFVEPGSDQEMSLMKQVGTALFMSAADHDGTFPTNLTGVTNYYTGSARVFEQFELLTMTQKSDEIQQPASTVLVRGKFTDANGRRTYLFADGHVEVRKDEK